MNIGFELTFIPNKPGIYKEFLIETEAIEINKAFNYALENLNNKFNEEATLKKYNFYSKVDIFRSDSWQFYGEEKQPHRSYCIEINNKPITFNTEMSLENHKDYLGNIFKIAKSLKLYPKFVKKYKDRNVFYPNGGSHLSLSTNFWADSASFLINLFQLERAFCLDYCNRPYIKWLFSDWNDNINSNVPITKESYKTEVEFNKNSLKNNEGYMNGSSYHDMALSCHSIKQRFANSNKWSYSAWEFRWFNMVANENELLKDIKFLIKWIEFHKANYKNSILDKKPLKLKFNDFDKLRDLEYAKNILYQFFSKIGLDFTDYLDRFEENYCNRIKYGKLL